MRKENKCSFLISGTSSCGENTLTCIIFDPLNCPKSRSKCIITTACWRIRNAAT